MRSVIPLGIITIPVEIVEETIFRETLLPGPPISL
jgi:hypothetical protein